MEALEFENLWRKDPGNLRKEILTIWKQYITGVEANQIEERLNQLVFVIKNEYDQVVGISTAYKAYVKQLRNYLYSVRILIIPSFRQPGLASKLIIETRDFLESVHQHDLPDKAIGIITLVENREYARAHNEAIWRASKMVYIGTSGRGYQARVYYFKGALIA